MMKSGCFCVRDQKAGVFHPPFLTHNRAVAMRMMSDVLSRADHSFAQHPSDYDLYELGSFDDVSGKFDLFDAPQHICLLVELVSQ